MCTALCEAGQSKRLTIQDTELRDSKNLAKKNSQYINTSFVPSTLFSLFPFNSWNPDSGKYEQSLIQGYWLHTWYMTALGKY